MKKILAMILAAATAVSISAAAMAQDVNSQIEASVLAAANSAAKVDAVPQGDPSGLVFGADKNNGNAVLGETILEPGVEYRFPVSMIIDGKTVPMTEELVKDMRFSYNKLSNTAVKTFKIEAYKGVYYLFVELKESVPNEVIDVKYTIKLTRKGESKLALFSQEVKFQFGYSEHNDDYINSLDKGDEVEIGNSNPVITDEQFERIAKINDYRNVTFFGPSWAFTVNVTGESTKNMLSNNAGIKEILSKFPMQEFKFFNFPSKPIFSIAGKVALDVDDIVDEFEELHAYRYANGKVYALKTELNEDTNMLEFRTNTLDRFFVTNKPIQDGISVGGAISGNVQGSTVNSGSPSKNAGKKNPSTGALETGPITI